MQNKSERYQHGKIYAIRSNETDEVYIGSTCTSLAKRLWNHRSDMRRYKACIGAYKTSYKILEYADHYIELIELHPCNSKEELCRREGEIMREHVNRVNKQLAGRTKAEYAADNIETVKIYKKQWADENKERLKDMYKQWNEAHKAERSKKILCECGSEITQGSKTRHIKTDKHKAYIAAL